MKAMAKKDKKKEKKVLKRKHTSFSALKEYNVLQPTPKLHFFIKLLYVIMKNFKLLIRSRTSALIFFFGPLFIMFIVSMGFNTSSLEGINIGVHSESYSPLADSLVEKLSEDFNVVKKESHDACINSVKRGTSHICVIFPKDMVMDNSGHNNIQVYADESRTNIADTVIDKLSTKVDLQSKELSSGIISQMLGAFDTINQKVEVGKQNIVTVNENTNTGLSKTKSLLSTIDEFDFTYTALDTSAVDDEINDVESSTNSSLSDLETLIDELETQFSTISGKLASAKEKATEVQEDAQDVKTSLQAAPAKIEEVKATLEEIKSTISALKVTNVASIVSPLKTTVKPLTANRSYLAYVLPTLLGLLVMFVSLLFSATSMIREKESSAHFRNFITPTRDILFIFGHLLSHLILITFEIAIMLGVAAIFIQGIPFTVYLVTGAVLILLAVLFIFVGMFLGNLFNSGESVTIAALSVATVSLLFSNAVLPLEAVSGFLRAIVIYNPFVIVESMLRQLLVFETIAFSNQFYVLFGSIAVAFILALVANKLRERVFNNG